MTNRHFLPQTRNENLGSNLTLEVVGDGDLGGDLAILDDIVVEADETRGTAINITVGGLVENSNLAILGVDVLHEDSEGGAILGRLVSVDGTDTTELLEAGDGVGELTHGHGEGGTVFGPLVVAESGSTIGLDGLKVVDPLVLVGSDFVLDLGTKSVHSAVRVALGVGSSPLGADGGVRGLLGVDISTSGLPNAVNTPVVHPSLVMRGVILGFDGCNKKSIELPTLAILAISSEVIGDLGHAVVFRNNGVRNASGDGRSEGALSLKILLTIVGSHKSKSSKKGEENNREFHRLTPIDRESEVNSP